MSLGYLLHMPSITPMLARGVLVTVFIYICNLQLNSESYVKSAHEPLSLNNVIKTKILCVGQNIISSFKYKISQVPSNLHFVCCQSSY